MKGGKLFAFAGLWERWAPTDGEAIESCTILTTDANELTKPIHDRMPVIVDPRDFKLWLDPAERPDVLQEMLRPYPPKSMEAYPVSTFVNNRRNRGPRCVHPWAWWARTIRARRSSVFFAGLLGTIQGIVPSARQSTEDQGRGRMAGVPDLDRDTSED